MELHTILAIAIPVVGSMAFFSGYYFGKVDTEKQLENLYYNRTKELIEAHNNAYSLGRISVAEEFKTFTNELKQKYTVPQFPADRT